MSFLLDALRAFLGGDAERDDEHDVAKDFRRLLRGLFIILQCLRR